MEDFFKSALYQEALEQAKLIIDTASERKTNIFGKNWYSSHFVTSSFARTQNDFDAILGQVHLTVAASTVNERSNLPIRGVDGFGKLKAEMLSFGHIYKMENDVLRSLAEYRNSASSTNRKQVVAYIVGKLLDIRRKAIDGVHERLDIIILGMLSNEGRFTITAENDPTSPFIGKTLDFGFNESHKANVTSDWNDANRATVNVFEDIFDVVDRMEVTPTKILTDKRTLSYMLTTDVLKRYINGNDNATKPITRADLFRFLEAEGLPTIEVVEKRSRIQNGATTTEINPWTEGKMLFVTDNKLGTIEHKMTDYDLGIKDPGVEYQKYGAIEVSSWVTGKKEGTHHTEHVDAKLTATPVWENALDCHSLDVLPSTRS